MHLEQGAITFEIWDKEDSNTHRNSLRTLQSHQINFIRRFPASQQDSIPVQLKGNQIL